MNLSNEQELLQLQKQARRRLVGAVILVLGALGILWNILDATPPAKLVVGSKVSVTSTIVGAVTAPATALKTVTTSEPEAASQAAGALLPTASIPSYVSLTPSPQMDKTALPGTLMARDSIEQTKVVESTDPLKVNKSRVDKSLTDKRNAATQVVLNQDPQRILDGLSETKVTSTVKNKVDAPIKYRIQIAAYSDVNKAQSIVEKLKAAGVRVSSEKIHTDKGELTRVRVGPYASRVDAEAALKKMHAQGINGMLVTK